MAESDLEKLFLKRQFTPHERLYARIVIYGPTAALIYAILSGALFELSYFTAGLLFVCYSATVLGVTVGYHRLLTHHAFKTKPWLMSLLVILGCMSYEGSPFFWIAAHRRHHKYTESEHDPHSPIVPDGPLYKRFHHAHTGWLLEHQMEDWKHYIPDLMQNPKLKMIQSHAYSIALLGLLIPAVINGLYHWTWFAVWQGFLICGLCRVAIQQHVTWSINSVCHLWGKRDFQCDDNSRNNKICALLSYGEGWHNGHHAFPTSAKHGLLKWQWDLSYGFIKLLSWFGLATDIRLPDAKQIEERRRR